MARVLKYSVTLDEDSFKGSISYVEKTDQTMTIATGTSDLSISLGGLTTAKAMLIESDQTITVNVNSSSGTDLTVMADRPAFLAGTSVTSLYVSNSSGSSASVTITLWGDA